MVKKLMTTLYLVTEGAWDSYQILGICSTEEKANDLIKYLKNHDGLFWDESHPIYGVRIETEILDEAIDAYKANEQKQIVRSA